MSARFASPGDRTAGTLEMGMDNIDLQVDRLELPRITSTCYGRTKLAKFSVPISRGKIS